MLYSYLLVGVAVLGGLIFPAATTRLLPLPLLVGLVVLGIAHGACDHQVIPALEAAPRAGGQMHSARYWVRFLTTYLGLASVVVALWCWLPAVSVAAFFLLTVWHWGSADAPATGSRSQWVLHSVLRGSFLFAVPGIAWSDATMQLINELLLFAGGSPVAEATFTAGVKGLWLLLLLGLPLLWLRYVQQQKTNRAVTDLLETLLLGGLLVVLPPVFSSGVYFVFWHSLQHVRRLILMLGYRAGGTAERPVMEASKFFGRRAWPLLLLSVLALLGLYGWWGQHAPLATFWLPLALVCASVVTLPHALLVTLVLDADNWRRAAAPAARPKRLLPTT